LAEAISQKRSFLYRMRNQDTNKEMTFFDHIEDLRWHILRSIVAILLFAIVIFLNIDWVYDSLILAPAREDFFTYRALCRFGEIVHMNGFCMPPVKIDLQVTTVNGTFTSALDIAMVGGIIVALPYVFWELWRFIKPALSAQQIKYSRGGVFWISVCFFTGGLFGYYLLAPFTFNFLANFTLGKSGIIIYRPSINDYISSLTNLIIGCGIAFELPVVSYILAKAGIINGSFLKRYFKFAFVIILCVAAVITPSPDWISQLIVSIPLLLLYWISVVLAANIEKQKNKQAL
jgi:sec-independent protein translocase protein TatC